MAIDQNNGTRLESGLHTGTRISIDANKDEALPFLTIAFRLRTQAPQKRFFEFQNVFNGLVREQRLLSCDGRIDKDDILKFVVTRGQNAGTLVDLCGIEEIEDREALNGQYFIHTLETQAAFAV